MRIGRYSRTRDAGDRGHTPAGPAQALVPPRQGHADRPLPQARRGGHAPSHLRGDEGLPDRAGRHRDAARGGADAADLRQEGGRLSDPARRARHARRRAHVDLRRARRVHRALPGRGDADAGRVLREAPAGRRRSRRDPARPDARDRQLDGACGAAREGCGRDERPAARDHRRAARGSRTSSAAIRTCRSSSPRSTAA